MYARIRHITIDCRDPYDLAVFWKNVLGFIDDPENPNEPGDPEALIIDPSGHHPGLLFVPVPEEKTTKNRVHLDLQPVQGRDETVQRLQESGGSVVGDHRRPDGTGWVVMADPEGNEFCVERSAADRGDIVAPAASGERKFPQVSAADERTMLTHVLDWYREGIRAKVNGVAPHHAAARPFRSESSIAGIVKHLALVEDSWFSVRFAGNAEPEPWAGIDWDADPDWEFRTARSEPLEDSLALYEAACRRARTITEDHHLDDLGADTTRREFSLRFVLVHMIEETSRHLGHLDILREHLDGSTGD